MHRGDALERGAELAVFLIDAPQVRARARARVSG